MSKAFDPPDMPIIKLKPTSRRTISRFEASDYLDTPEIIRAFLADVMKEGNPRLLMQALGEVAKARGVHRLAEETGVNRESLYKAFEGGGKTRFDTMQKLMHALGVELTVKPLGNDRGHI